MEGIKKSVTLHRFNKAIDCLTQKFIQNEKVSFHVRCYGSCFFRFLCSTDKGVATDSVATDSAVVVEDTLANDTVAADTLAADTVSADSVAA